MYNYNKLLAVITFIAVLVSVFTLSASAEGVNTSVDDTSSVLSSDVPVDDVLVPVEENVSSESLEQTNEYLKYITGFLCFIVIVIWFVLIFKLFNWFF